MKQRSGWVALTMVSIVCTACVGPAYDRTRDARDAYEACRAEHPDDSEACTEERELARREYDRYERDAQRQWGDRERSWTP